MFRTVFERLSPGGARARLSVLIFHRVLPAADPLFPEEMDAPRFDTLCGWLRTWFNVLPLDEAVTRLTDGSLPARSLAITFDDGYRDNHDVALPILRQHGLTATFFVATGFLDGGRMWNDSLVEAIRRTDRASIDVAGLPGGELLPASGRLALDSLESRQRAIHDLLPRVKYLAPDVRQGFVDSLVAALDARDGVELMMSTAQVRALRKAGMQVGAHTVSHPILARLDAAAATEELTASRATLEAMLDEPVTLFAYPNGKPGDDYSPGTVDLVRRAGFKAAVSTAWGAARRNDDTWQLPRFTPWDRSRLAFGARLASNLRRAPTAPFASAR